MLAETGDLAESGDLAETGDKVYTSDPGDLRAPRTATGFKAVVSSC